MPGPFLEQKAGKIVTQVLKISLEFDTFLMVEVLGLSHQEVADIQNVRVGTVKSRMFRARQALCLGPPATTHEKQSTLPPIMCLSE